MNPFPGTSRASKMGVSVFVVRLRLNSPFVPTTPVPCAATKIIPFSSSARPFTERFALSKNTLYVATRLPAGSYS